MCWFQHVDAQRAMFGGSPFGCVSRTIRASPPSPLRGSGATTFSRLAEPKLGEAERRLVDLTGASWNRLTSWLRKVEALRSAA
jgi:hypothetical protein